MYYFLVFVLLLAVELTYFRLADRFNIIDKPNERSSHTRVTLRGGGIIFYFGVLFYFLTNRFEYPWFVTGLTLITIVSFIDDIHSVSKRARLAIHVTAMLLLFYQWGLLTLPWWYIPIALIFCTGIINAYNFMDGINGITGGYSLVVLGSLLYINEYRVNFVEPSLPWIVIIALTVFNIFNFRKKAKCFAGDVGSVSIAFIILFLLGKLVIQTRDLSYIILLVVYGVDSVLTIVHRLLLHENISLPHRKHLYQLMANELRIPHTVVSGFYMLLQSIICIGYIYCEDYGYRYLISMILILSCGYIWFMKKYFRLHSIKQK
ncbi:glycosyltransferase family 4 protein [uncultured Sanguibacteroides sp.]|uniref:MraY family glycosyltransferase n=1 Tax=uncultured Sanguibacteroides sp. TaxID=1635151 RepID=UPI0025CFF727|nr:glycosyltransferase family 4 protein [uncultured Sanguibacteroides sp.]